MKPFFNRVGSKRSIRDKVYSLFPKDYDIYVEPFIGGGALYFYKEPSKKEVINDLDKQLAEGYKLLKKADTDESHYQLLDTIPAIQNFVDKKVSNNNDRLLQLLYTHNNTFSSKGIGKIYKEASGKDRINNLEEYKKRLKNTTILNQNYKKVIEKYDSDKTFFYLDPPYGTASSDYAHLYKFLEEYLYESTLDTLSHIQNGSRRFIKHKGYQEQFEKLLSLGGYFVRICCKGARGRVIVGSPPSRRRFLLLVSEPRCFHQ
jgi:site-specific DNA-adenine methylase